MQEPKRYEEELVGPELLSIPPKLLDILTLFNLYKIIVLEGGRGSAKSHSIARLLLYIAQERIVRIFCGREIQGTIEESVYALLCDLIGKYQLAYRVTKASIRSLLSASSFRFKGFREQGSINIKGIEGADIAWIDEAQSITKPTLDLLLPTLRKSNCKFLFTMNRLYPDDAVMELTKRKDCLHIHIDYFENPFCPVTLLDEAELCRQTSEREYNHIWLGMPAAAGDFGIFDFAPLYKSIETKPFGDTLFRQRVLGIDWAAQGNDLCVGTILDRASPVHWELNKQLKWDEPNTTISTGKIITMIAEYKPDIIIIDIGGGGYNVYCDLIAAGIKNVFPFDGASTSAIGPRSLNMRADGYWNLKDFFESGFLCLQETHRPILKQLEKLRQVFSGHGKRQVEPKKDYKSREGFSPDEGDSLMMAVYGIRYLNKIDNSSSHGGGNGVTRKTGSQRRR